MAALAGQTVTELALENAGAELSRSGGLAISLQPSATDASSVARRNVERIQTSLGGVPAER